MGQKKLSENHKKEEKAEDGGGGSAKSHQHVARLSNKQRRKTKEALSQRFASFPLFVIFITLKRKEVGVILSYVSWNTG